MLGEMPPAFLATHKGKVYRVCVTPSELFFVQLRARMQRNKNSNKGAITGGLLGGALGGAIGGMIDEASDDGRGVMDFESQIEEEQAMLDGRDAEGLRVYIKTMKRGFTARRKDLDEVRVDAVAKWKRLFFSRPDPALVIRHRERGRLTFLFRTRQDAVIGIYELQRAFGEDLDLRLNLTDYKKRLRKYEKMRGS